MLRDAELPAQLEVAVGPRVVELPAAGVAVPLGGVELDALEAEPLGVRAQLVEARPRRCAGRSCGCRSACPGAPAASADASSVWPKPVVVELAEVGGLEDRVVDVAVVEQVLHQPLAALVEVLLVGPHLGLGGEVAVVVVEAVDELLAVDVALVLRAGVPQRDVGVDDEVARRRPCVYMRSPSVSRRV